VDEEFKILAVEVRGSGHKYAWEIVSLYRAPNKDTLIIEKLAARTAFLGCSVKQSIIGGDLNVPQVDRKEVEVVMSGTQAYINRWVWDPRIYSECWTLHFETMNSGFGARSIIRL
jgi:hypothetical protein